MKTIMDFEKLTHDFKFNMPDVQTDYCKALVATKQYSKASKFLKRMIKIKYLPTDSLKRTVYTFDQLGEYYNILLSCLYVKMEYNKPEFGDNYDDVILMANVFLNEYQNKHYAMINNIEYIIKMEVDYHAEQDELFKFIYSNLLPVKPIILEEKKEPVIVIDKETIIDNIEPIYEVDINIPEIIDIEYKNIIEDNVIELKEDLKLLSKEFDIYENTDYKGNVSNSEIKIINDNVVIPLDSIKIDNIVPDNKNCLIEIGSFYAKNKMDSFFHDVSTKVLKDKLKRVVDENEFYEKNKENANLTIVYDHKNLYLKYNLSKYKWYDEYTNEQIISMLSLENLFRKDYPVYKGILDQYGILEIHNNRYKACYKEKIVLKDNKFDYDLWEDIRLIVMDYLYEDKDMCSFNNNMNSFGDFQGDISLEKVNCKMKIGDKFYDILIANVDRVLLPTEHFRFGYCKFKEYRYKVKAGKTFCNEVIFPICVWKRLISLDFIGGCQRSFYSITQISDLYCFSYLDLNYN